MMKNFVLIVSLIFSCVSLTLSFVNKESLVYVDTGKLFAEFKMAKELNKQMEGIQNVRKNILDSLYRTVNVLSEEIRLSGKKEQEKLNKLSLLQDEFNYKQQKFQEENNRVLNDYNTKIWSQLSQYLNDYGKKNNYSIVFGANGQGSIMYALDKKDITKDALEYVNARYDDKVK